MPDVASVRRPRRWWRVVRTVSILIAVVLVAAFCWAGTLASWMVSDHLPWTASFPHGSLTVRQVGTASPVPAESARPELQVVASPAAARALVSAASERWLPPALLRGGQHVLGDVSLPILRPEPFTWQVLVAGQATVPVATLRVSHRDLTHFLRTHGQTVLKVGGTPIMRCIYIVDWGRIEDADEPGQPPLVRRHRVVARGSILLIAGQAQRTLVVRRLSGHAWSTLVPVPAGYRLKIRVAIEDADAEPIILPVIGDARPMLLKQLESAANEGLEEGLEKVVLPAWFPIGLRTDVTVE